MALNLPLPVPPRTPTPPPDDEEAAANNALPAGAWQQASKFGRDPNALSPLIENFPPRYSSGPSSSASYANSSQAAGFGGLGVLPLSPTSPVSTASSLQISSGGTSPAVPSHDISSPFRFKSTTLAKTPLSKSTVGQRRGHKYKHSSVSHQVFQEPLPRAPLPLPASLPVPTFKECRKSMSKEQRSRISWCLCHASIAAYTLWSAQGSLAMTALSHLIMFDALGATLCVVVDVLGNFEVWRRPSIRHPFGLERVEVLAGFAMSVFLLFMGLDLISHNVQHMLESPDSHNANNNHHHHHPHHHHHEAAAAGAAAAKHPISPHDAQRQGLPRVAPGSIDVAALLAIVATLVSALGLGNHARIGRAMRFASMDALLPALLSNPAHLLTLSCSALLLLLPLLAVRMPAHVWLDRALAGAVAVCMCALGVRLVKALGAMLLMSYAGSSGSAGRSGVGAGGSVGARARVGTGGGSGGVEDDNVPLVLRDIAADASVCAVDEARFWQVHYGLCMGCVKLRVRGTEATAARVRDKVASLVRNRLGGGYRGSGGPRWEVSTQVTLDGSADFSVSPTI